MKRYVAFALLYLFFLACFVQAQEYYVKQGRIYSRDINLKDPANAYRLRFIPGSGTLSASRTITLDVNSDVTLTFPLPISLGGTGLATLPATYIPYGDGTGALKSNQFFYFDEATYTLNSTYFKSNMWGGTNSITYTSTDGYLLETTVYYDPLVGIGIGITPEAMLDMYYGPIRIRDFANYETRWTTLDTDTDGNFTVDPYGGYLILKANTGSVGIRAQTDQVTDIKFDFPSDVGTSGYCLKTDGATPATLSWGTCAEGAGAGITSLGGETGAAQTFANDTNVTITSSGDVHTVGWAGQLSVARGGTGAATLTGIPVGTGTAAMTALAPVRGDIVTAQGAVPAWAKKAAGTRGKTLSMAQYEPEWYDSGCNILAFGGSTSDIQTGYAAAVAAGCRDIYIPAGTYTITTAVTIATSGVRLRGASSEGTVIIWNGSDYAAMINIVNGTSLNENVSIEDLHLDANSKASTFISLTNGIDFFAKNIVGHSWKGLSAASPGWALKVAATAGLGCGGGHWINCTFNNPIGSYAYALSLAANNAGNINEMSFDHCRWMISDVAGAEGIRLGFADHCYFTNCQVWNYGGSGYGHKGIVIAPQAVSSAFPVNISFINTPLPTKAGVYVDTTTAWTSVSTPAIIFYPFHRADLAISPPFAAYALGAQNASTVGSSTTITTTSSAFANVVVGARIYTSVGERWVTAKASDNSITVSVAINLTGGYAFYYTPLLPKHFMVVGIADDGTPLNIPRASATTVASADTITLYYPIARITGTTTINNITLYGSGLVGFYDRPDGGWRVTLIPASAVSTGTGGNIQEAIAMSANRAYDFQYLVLDGGLGTGGKWYKVD